MLILRQSMPLFDVGVDVDKQSKDFILQLTVPKQLFLRTGIDNWSGLDLLKDQCLQKQNAKISGLNINLDEIYQSYQECQKDYSSYLNSIESVIRDLGTFSHLDSQTLLEKIKAIRFSIEFEVLNNLDVLPSQEILLKDFINKKYVIRKVSDLQFHYPIFEWRRLFEILSGKEINNNTIVQVYFVDYFQKVFKNLLIVDKKELNNAFLAIHAYDLFINTVVPKQKFDRNHFCLDLSKKLLPDIYSYSVGQTISISKRQKENNKIKKLFEILKKKFCSNLFYSEWIDDSSKISISQKCETLNLTFYEPPNEDTLSKDYDNVTITTDYQINIIHLLADLKRKIYSLAGTPFTGEKIFSYFLNPLSTKCKTFYASPIIIVPLGLSQKTSSGLPNYLLQARTGFALARQIARHFDPTGMRYGIKLYSSAEDQYNDFTLSMETLMDDASPYFFQNKNLEFTVKGTLSLNERIVDNAAFKLISDSVDWSPDEDILPYISADYSREKVFFIATAQEFCKQISVLDFMLHMYENENLPPALKVKNIMGNSHDFAEKFSCADGSDMDLSLKIQFPFIDLDEENIQQR